MTHQLETDVADVGVCKGPAKPEVSVLSRPALLPPEAGALCGLAHRLGGKFGWMAPWPQSGDQGKLCIYVYFIMGLVIVHTVI